MSCGKKKTWTRVSQNIGNWVFWHIYGRHDESAANKQQLKAGIVLHQRCIKRMSPIWPNNLVQGVIHLSAGFLQLRDLNLQRLHCYTDYQVAGASVTERLHISSIVSFGMRDDVHPQESNPAGGDVNKPIIVQSVLAAARCRSEPFHL